MGCQQSAMVSDVPNNVHSLQQTPQPMPSIENIMEGKQYPLNETKTLKIINKDNKENNLPAEPRAKCEKQSLDVRQTQSKQGYFGKCKSKSEVKKTAKFDVPFVQVQNQDKQPKAKVVGQGQKSKACSLKVVDEHTKYIQNIGPSTISIGQIEEKPQTKALIKKQQLHASDRKVSIKAQQQPKVEQKIIKAQLDSSQSKRSSTSSTFKFQIFASSGQLISQTQKMIQIQISNQQKQEVDRYLKTLLQEQTKDLVNRIILHLQQKQLRWRSSTKNIAQEQEQQ